MPNVYMTDYTYAHLDYETAILAPLGYTVIGRQCKTAADVVAQCGDAVALLNQYAPLTREVFANLPNLKMIVRYGVGYDSVDVQAATDHGVMVVNVPDYGVQEVADHTLALLLALVRKVPAVVNDVQAGNWNDNTFHPIIGLTGKRVGLLGFGNIARQVAKRVQAFDMEVMAYDPFVSADVFAQHHAVGADLATVLAQSDIVCVHLPLNADTKHTICAATLAQMKPTAYLSNPARGGVVHSADLAQALRNGQIAGAALDVLDVEPMPADHPLRGVPNCLITCHLAWYSEASLVRLQQYAALEVARMIRGESPKSVVNRAALQARGVLP
ncbi:MAG: C-terminal binding protein [Roseiflexaceae bacterium]